MVERSKVVRARLTPEEMGNIKTAADRLEMTMSEFLRKTAIESARAVLDSDYVSSINRWSNSTGKVLIARLEAAKIMDENDS